MAVLKTATNSIDKLKLQTMLNPLKICACGRETKESYCCEHIINGQEIATTPLQLMRSRYAAYVLKRYDYIQNSMQGPALEKFNIDKADSWSQTLKWEGLSILSFEMKSPTLGYVSFKAYYEEKGQHGVIAEKSEFHKIDGKWFYYDGKALNPRIKPTIKPDAPCICQNDKPYRECCGQKEFQQ